MKTYLYAGLGIALLSGAALGADVHITRDAYGEVRAVAVHAADLDLMRSAGAQELLQRLQFAAVRVCDAETPERDLARLRFQRACVADTMNRAVASVSSPLVQRLYAVSRDR